MKILLTNNYYSGCYCEIGDLTAGGNQAVVTVEKLPAETDALKQLAYKWTGISWEFTQSRYDELLQEMQAREQANISYNKIGIKKIYSQVQYLAMLEGIDL